MTPAEAAAELIRRRELRKSLRTWALHYLPHHFPDQASRFHEWLTAKLEALRERRGVKLAVVAPRGSAKSTWSSLAYPLYVALHNLEPYIVITSDSSEQAEKYLDAIRAELQGNEALRAAYPWIDGPGALWRTDRIRLPNGVQIEALGTGTKLRGRKTRQHRPTLIIVDDPQNTDHVISQLQRERSWEWLVKDICNAGSGTTNILVLGTALHRECIVCRLQQTPGWESRLFQAIVRWPDRMDLWREWEDLLNRWEDPEREAAAGAFYHANRVRMDGGAELLWPAREPLLALMTLRATIGPAAFESEKQGNPIDPSRCEWPETHFNWPGFWFDAWPADLAVRVLALDPSKGKDAHRGDFSAYVRLGMDHQGVEYVEADLQRRDSTQIVEDGAAHVREFRPDVLAVEVNGFQELLCGDFERVFQREHLELNVARVNNSVNKLVRIRRLGPPLAQRKVRFKSRSPGTMALVKQLQDFPVGDHDDGPDALEMGRRTMAQVLDDREEEGGVTVIRT